MKKIVFFKMGGFSKINAHIRDELIRSFPDYGIETIDVLSDILECRFGWRSSLILRACLRYGLRIVNNRQNPRDFFIRFDDAWAMIHNWVCANVDPENVIFTIQTQSLFDARHPSIAHFIYTDHTYLANRRYPNPARPLPVTLHWLNSEKELYQRATVNFTTSKFCERSIIEDYAVPLSSVECVFSGVNIPIPQRARPRPEKCRRILFAGVDWERKGGPDLVKSFLEIQKRLPDTELWIVGCNPSIRQKGIRVFGRVSTDEMQKFYHEADIFCLPSRYEPSATVIAEAACNGLPVVTTAIGGSVGRVKNEISGLLIPPNDVSALTAALIRLLTEPSLAKAFGDEGRKLVNERFTWEQVMKKMKTRIMKEIPCLT